MRWDGCGSKQVQTAKPFNVEDLVIRAAVVSDSVPDSDAKPSDAAQIARIYNHYVDAGGATYDNVHWETSYVEQLLQIRPPDVCYVAELSGRILGWASARRFSDRHGYRFSCETAIYLDAQATRKGVGDLLQQKIDWHCRENKIHHAVAKIIASNQHSLAFHYRHGYELVGVQKEIGNVDGQWSDVAILQRVFT